MSRTVNVHAAKTHFSKLLERVEEGEEVIIARAGRPVARLLPMPSRRVRYGAGRGLWIAEDFDAPLPAEVLRAFVDDPVMPRSRRRRARRTARRA